MRLHQPERSLRNRCQATRAHMDLLLAPEDLSLCFTFSGLNAIDRLDEHEVIESMI